MSVKKNFLFRIRWLLSALACGAIVFFIYASSLNVSFFADDFNFLEPVARLSLGDYLVHYFDPRVQVLWYRPLQGIQIFLEYWAFGAGAFGYHVVQVLIHWVNGILLFALVRRAAGRYQHHFVSLRAERSNLSNASERLLRRQKTPPRNDIQPRFFDNADWLALLATLFYVSFPVYALAINWINITDPAMTIFYLLGVWFWLNYLDRNSTRDYFLTLALFIAALFFKQMALTLPGILLLLDLLFYRDDFDAPNLGSLIQTTRALAPRYAPFAVVALAFFGIQNLASSTHTFAGVFGYSVGPHIFSILAQYLALLFFPWGYYPASDTQITNQIPDFIPLATIIWMFVALAAYFVAIIHTRSRALIFLGAGAFITLLPVLPFPFIELRYLYLPAMFSGIGFAALVVRALRGRGLKWSRGFAVVASIALALLILGNAAAVTNANAEIAEIARQRRVPFRDISSAHPRFPDDTYLYFIDPVSPLPELKGLFALRYGRGVTVGGNDASDSDAWRDHKNTWVYYFDDTGKPIEVAVEPNARVQTNASLPANFGEAIALERVDIAQSKIKRGGVLIAQLLWRATAAIDRDYTVFVHLVDRNGKMIASYDSPPRKGKLPTHEWILNARVVDAVVLPLPADAPSGDGYALQVGLYRADTSKRLMIQNSSADAVTILGLSVE